MDNLLTAAELADRLRISQRTLRNWISAGSIPFLKLGCSRRSLVRFSLPAVEEWLARHSNTEAEQPPAASPRRGKPGKASEATVSRFSEFVRR